MASTAWSRRYHAIQNQLTPPEKELIKIYEFHWNLGHRVPSVEEVTAEMQKKMPKIRQTSVNYYLMRAPVRKALTQRGIKFEQHTREGLTDQQQAAALVVMNMMDTRSIESKLDSIGVLPATYQAWLNDPEFKTFITELAENNKINVRPTAITEFTKKINAGDWNAIKYWMDATGELTNSDAPQSEQIIRMVVEIIQKHVKDEKTILAIAGDMMAVLQNRTYQPAITGEVVDQEEFEVARKQLGV